MVRITMRKREDPIAGDLGKEGRNSLHAAHHGAGFAATAHQSCGGFFLTGARLSLVTEVH